MIGASGYVEWNSLVESDPLFSSWLATMPRNLAPVDARATTNNIVMGTNSIIFGGGSGQGVNFIPNG